MAAEEKETPRFKPRLSIPAGAVAILPLRNTVLFPSTIMPLAVGRAASLQLIEEAVRQQLPVGFVAQRDPKIEGPQPKDLFGVGTAADILRMFGLPDGQRQIIIQGRQRFEIAEFLETDPFLVARVTMVAETVPHSKEFEARILNLRQEAARALSLLPCFRSVPSPRRLPTKIACCVGVRLPTVLPSGNIGHRTTDGFTVISRNARSKSFRETRAPDRIAGTEQKNRRAG